MWGVLGSGSERRNKSTEKVETKAPKYSCRWTEWMIHFRCLSDLNWKLTFFGHKASLRCRCYSAKDWSIRPAVTVLLFFINPCCCLHVTWIRQTQAVSMQLGPVLFNLICFRWGSNTRHLGWPRHHSDLRVQERQSSHQDLQQWWRHTWKVLWSRPETVPCQWHCNFGT